MKLQLTPRKKSILNEMGISLYYKKAIPLQVPQLPKVPAIRPRPLTSSSPPAHPTPNKPPIGAGLPNPALISQVAKMNWVEIEAHLQTCRACDLGHNAPLRYIEAFKVENSNTEKRSKIDWLIVSDSPKRALDGSVVAFSENSLALFNAILKHLLFASPPLPDRKTPVLNYFITHTVKCLSPKLEAPDDVATQTCLIHLKQQIKLLEPQLLLVMGQAAAHALLQDTPLKNEPLGKLRSKLHQFENTPMIATYSPEQMMRSGEIKSNAWTDLCWAHSLIH